MRIKVIYVFLFSIIVFVMIGTVFSSSNITLFSYKALALESNITSQNSTTNTNRTAAAAVDNLAAALNQNNSQSKLDVGDVAPYNTGAAAMVAKELSEKNPDEIATYPLNDLAPAVIEKALKILSVADLEKTLKSISSDALREILNDKLMQGKATEILNRLPQNESQQILHRIQ
jgi:hypothetical protein